MDRTKRSGIYCALCLVACCATAGAVPLDTLIRQLGGDDEIARSNARQLLPRMGVEAVPRLLPLLKQENPAVWCAAFQTLADFANTVSVPGREADRLMVTGQLMTLVAPSEPQPIKERGLRLLPLVTPEGYDIAPVAALLQDPEPILREKARAALQEIGSTEAAQALADALPNTDPEFKCLLLNGLAGIKKEKTLSAALAMTRDADPAVRAAAARAVAWTGNPAYLTDLRAVRAASTPETSFDATDALLRLADAMGYQGGNWNATLGIYREVLETGKDIVQKSGAISGLGRFGDETVIPEILAALQGPDARDLEPAALAAFDSLQGAAVAKALLAAYPAVSEDMQLSLIATFGRKQNPAYLDLLNETAHSEVPALRQIALKALVHSQLPGALPGLMDAARGSVPEDKEIAIGGLKRLGQLARDHGQRDTAGKAFLALYQAADSAEMKQEALEGIKQCPVPEAFDVILADIGPEEMANLPVGTMAGIAKAMADAGRTEEANRLIDDLLPRIDTTEGIRDALQFLGPMKSDPPLAARLGLIPSWQLIGGFHFDMSQGFPTCINEPNIDLSATYPIGDKTVGWTPYTSADPAGLVDLMGTFGALDHACAYAYTEISVPEAADAVVRAGSDDGIKIWVNGEVVLENNVDRGTVIDQDQAPVKLVAGKNVLLAQISQNGGGWSFCLRLTKPDGTVLPYSVVK